jgi:hypothetical protein
MEWSTTLCSHCMIYNTVDNTLEQGSPNYGPRATSGPRCDFIRPAKEQIITTAGVVHITTFALKTTYAQFSANCLLSLIYDNLFSRTLYLVYEML